VTLLRRLPERLRPALDGFREVLGHVERARRALTDAVPTTRLPGRPLAEALLLFEDELSAAERSMPSWRDDALEAVWRSCSDAIVDARRQAERLRLGPHEPDGFEGLIGSIGDVLAPLEAFGRVGDRFRMLARRR
jgi:hypothetical protein